MTHPLQTKEWAEFRKAWGNEVLETKYGIITLHNIPLTSYKIGIFEKGPQPTAKMLEDLKRIGGEKGLIFIKLEPNVTVKIQNPKLKTQNPTSLKLGGTSKAQTNHQSLITNHPQKLLKLLRTHGATPGKTLFTPTTFWIDLTKSEKELLQSFSSKTRYNIRLAERKGVKVSVNNSDKAFEKYLQLTFETTKRQGFYAHTPEYHRLMWKHLNLQPTNYNLPPIAYLITATYKKEIITTWILFAYNGFLYYPYGASTDKHKNVMANNLMMWEAIKFGKKQGLHTFDLWGREPGKGFTRFKEGYNPAVVEFIGSWDLIINKPLYGIYRILETLRWRFLKLKGKIKKISNNYS